MFDPDDLKAIGRAQRALDRLRETFWYPDLVPKALDHWLNALNDTDSNIVLGALAAMQFLSGWFELEDLDVIDKKMCELDELLEEDYVQITFPEAIIEQLPNLSKADPKQANALIATMADYDPPANKFPFLRYAFSAAFCRDVFKYTLLHQLLELIKKTQDENVLRASGRLLLRVVEFTKLRQEDYYITAGSLAQSLTQIDDKIAAYYINMVLDLCEIRSDDEEDE